MLSLNEVLGDVRKYPSNNFPGSRVGLSPVLQGDIITNLADDAHSLKLVGSKSMNHVDKRAVTPVIQPVQTLAEGLKLNREENPDSPLFNLKIQKESNKNSVFHPEKSAKRVDFLDQLSKVNANESFQWNIVNQIMYRFMRKSCLLLWIWWQNCESRLWRKCFRTIQGEPEESILSIWWMN